MFLHLLEYSRGVLQAEEQARVFQLEEEGVWPDNYDNDDDNDNNDDDEGVRPAARQRGGRDQLAEREARAQEERVRDQEQVREGRTLRW